MNISKRNINISIPKDVKFILNRLRENNGKAYAVGGCIRDSLMGKEPNDWDITTNLIPQKVVTLFPEYNIVEKGIEYGTISVFINDCEYEITTFRKDAGSKDCRHPEEVSFSNSIEEDLERRDFTVNAMAYNLEDGLIDPFNGYEDLNLKILKAVGNPNERFKEDALRMMRAIRLAAQHGFTIEEKTYNAITENNALIKNISQERFNKELSKTLLSENPEYVEEFYKTGLATFIFPELVDIFECIQDNPNHWRGKRATTVGEHTIDVLKNAVVYGDNNSIYNQLDVRLALLTHDFGKPTTKSRRVKKDFGEIDSFFGHPEKSAEILEDCLKRLRYPKSLISRVSKLVKYHDIEFAKIKNGKIEPNGSALRKAYAEFGGMKKNSIEEANKLLEKLFAVRICDASGQNPEGVEGFSISSVDKVEEIKLVIDKVRENYSIVDVFMPINGEDVRVALGLTSKGMKVHGKFIGTVLNKLQEKVIKDNRFLKKLEPENSYETILSYAQSMGMKNIVSEEFFEK